MRVPARLSVHESTLLQGLNFDLKIDMLCWTNRVRHVEIIHIEVAYSDNKQALSIKGTGNFV